jgi:hypothetical protein
MAEPNLIQRLQTESANIPVADLAGDIIGQLQTAISLFEKLPEAPEEGLQGLLTQLGDVPIPQVQVAAQVGSQITQIASSMPTDLSSLTGAFDPILENLEKTLGGDLIPTVRRFIDIAKAVDALTRFDLNDAAAGPGASGGGAPAGGGASGGASGASGAGGSGSGSGGAGSGAGGGGAPAAGSPGAGSGPGADAPAGPSDAVKAARERRLAALSSSRQGLANLPSPLDAPGLVVFLERLLSGVPRANAKMRKLPFFDDMQQLLQTVVDIRHKSEPDLKAHIAQSLQKLAVFLDKAFAGYLAAYGSQVQAFANAANPAALRSDTLALKNALEPVAAALEAGNLSGTSGGIAAANAALDALLPRLAMLNSPVGRSNVEKLADRTRLLPLELERQMRQLIQMLEPANTFRFLAQAQEPLARALSAYDPAKLAEDLRGALEKPLELLDLIEASGVQEVLQAPTEAIRTIMEQMDAVMGQVASQTAALFDNVDQVLAQADPQALLQQVHQAFETFRLALESKARELFAPVAQAVQDAFTAIQGAVDGFKPDAIIQSIKDFLGKVAEIFETEPIKGALDALQAGIRDATEKIQAIHFSPVTDAVEDQISSITTVLRAIEPATLSTEVKLALTAAAALLPDDLDPVTGPMVQGFNALVDEGPKQWLGFLSDKAAEVKSEIEKFNPANLIGDALSAPFQDFLKQLEAFQPMSLLAPVNDALAGFRQDLIKRLDPTPALKPLQDAYDGLLRGFDSLNPARLIEPVNAAIHTATHAFREALPLDEIAEVLSAVLDKIQHAFDLADETRQSLEQLANLFAALEGSEQQLRAWLQPLLNRVDGFTDVSTMAADAAAIAAGVDNCKAAALAAAVENAWGPFKTQLTALAPGATLEELIALRRRLRPDRLAAIPGAPPEKAALETLMARFEPLASGFSTPLQSLQGWLAAQSDAAAEMTVTLSRWDARHHRAGGPVAGLVLPDFTAAAFKEILRKSLEDEFILPVSRLFEFVFNATNAARLPLLEIAQFLQTFQDRAEAMLTGSTALGGLRDGLLALADRIEGINLDFLKEQLDEVFQAIKGKLDIIDPAHLSGELQATLDSAIGLLSVDLLLTPAAKTAIDAAYNGLVEDLKTLDPKTILEQAVQPVYDEKVKPNILKLDLVPLLTAMLAKLEELKGELETELDDVNAKYKEMIDAIPQMDAGEAIGAAADAIGGSIGF